MSLFDDDLIYDDDDAAGGDMFSGEGNVAPPEGLSPAKSATFCLEHDAQEKLFLDLYNKDTLPHAMIFSGLEGVGKTTMAFRLARFLLKSGKKDTAQDGLFGGEGLPQDAISLDVAAEDPVFARIASGGHADLLHISRDYDTTKGKQAASLKVEALRKIEPFLRKTASEGGWRIVIVEDADTMNRNAQNAILKILEEPPANVLIILIAHRPGMLIPTIHSRARVIPFSSLSTGGMAELLQKAGISKLSVQEMETLSAISGGSIGHALAIAEDNGLKILSDIIALLHDIPQWDWRKIHELSNAIATNDKEYQMFKFLFPWVFKHMVFIKARGEQSLPSYLQSSELEHIFSTHTLNHLITIADGLQEHFERVDFSNLDRRDAVRAAFLVISD